MTPRLPDPPGLDLARLEQYLRREHPSVLGDGPLTAQVIAGGRSNLTYRVDGAVRPLVVRRPPLGHVQTTAHDMAREHRVISALAGTRVPVPPTVALVDDPSAGTGTVFYVMDLVEGTVLAHPAQNAVWSPGDLRAVSLELAALLAELHAIDPADVGLADLGRADGYLDRQLRRWRTQLEGSRSRPVPRLDDLQERLGERVPTTRRSSIVHGDYRLDNVLVGAGPRITAILDWEMATIGDCAVDLGMLGLYWHIRDVAGAQGVAPSAVDPAAGYPEFDELVDVYCARLGTGVPELGWYRAFAAYKLAVILEGIHFRFLGGDTVGEGFDRIGGLVEPLADEGLAQLAGVR
ncbi:phosphotransferase family protein [Cellulomonas fengjieae]|uniref:Phosphotransferase family protein n=1 Tax=Cellulomonas fengjieae TaxID=2819978 RepID=A0ABS3SD17_9CELL|nr:phosphotransferase family protein [Cellulomonas fengjieae]MBO3083643.1 phosphotransferase family protein [Cellulomonas fengjieae]MBO3101605.1 phosphotransferase family protein [Cellulomonas fengjieae]QVI65045.1 phosphotransferase family protein [Cellulomonas fengjieae]